MKLLHLDSSIHGADSVSRQLSAAVVAQYQHKHSGLEVVYRDLAAQPLSHIDLAIFTAGPQGYPSEAGVEIAESGVVLDEFLAADIVVIGAPMYNFAIPSQLKAWLDRIVVPGKTFKYEETGPKGLATGKTAVVVSSRGGMYGEGAPMAVNDHQETHLRAILGFLGIQDIKVVRAEGVAYGPEHRQQAISKALAAIPEDVAGVSAG